MRKILLILVLIGASTATGHPGRLDAYGCHTDTATGYYGWHEGPLDGWTSGSKATILEALDRSVTIPTTPTTTQIGAYNRDDYLPSWADVDGDCINTRHEVLIVVSLIPVTMNWN